MISRRTAAEIRRMSEGGTVVRSALEAASAAALTGGFSVVREYMGHGIGRRLHEHPEVPNVGTPGLGVRLEPGMALAIEPMLNLGEPDTRMGEDRWTILTADGSISAHAEHTVVVTDAEPLVLTAPRGRRDLEDPVNYSIAVPFPRSTHEPSEARVGRVRSVVGRSTT